MGVHHVSWQSTASGLEDEYIHAAALSWLVGDEDAVEMFDTSSLDGGLVYLMQ